nr:RNA-directed DNA polymerase, eukaryota, reverse transcriptase zinc-binding domain protein [Tanacetum cinerariifolium]
MKGSLGKLVDQNQSAFVPNRHIQDNILLSQELLKGYERMDGPNRVAMKINIQKAYDTDNWQFLESNLREFGFHEKMVGWIVKCVTTASFSICVNGERFGYFKGGRGLRQDDPMSPYLFTLMIEVLTLIVKDKVEKNKNFSKSTIIFGSMADEDKQSILKSVPFKVESLLDSNKILKSFLWNQGENSKGKAKLRNEVRSYFVMKIGNGVKENVVYDNWSTIGILQSFISHRDTYDARLNANMVVKDLIFNGVCKWPNEWIAKYPILSQQLSISLDEHKEDELLAKAKMGLHHVDMGWNEMVESFSKMYNGNYVDSIVRRLGLVASVGTLDGWVNELGVVVQSSRKGKPCFMRILDPGSVSTRRIGNVVMNLWWPKVSVYIPPVCLWQILHPDSLQNIIKSGPNIVECTVTKFVEFIDTHQRVLLVFIMIYEASKIRAPRADSMLTANPKNC